jgi:hypothetical protein
MDSILCSVLFFDIHVPQYKNKFHRIALYLITVWITIQKQSYVIHFYQVKEILVIIMTRCYNSPIK